MAESFQDSMSPSGGEPTKDGSPLAGRAAIDLYFGLIGQNNRALKSQVAKLAIALELHRAMVAEAERSAK